MESQAVTTTRFYGHGKKSVVEKVIKIPKARELLSRCGDDLPISADVLNCLKIFVLKYIYGINSESCAVARASQWKKMKKKNTLRLVPDDDTLRHICIRANYLSYCQKHFQLKDHPQPFGHGWELINGKCRPIRYTSPALPSDISSGSSCNSSESESSDTESSGSSDLSDSESSDSDDVVF